jgi:hypothetical protein
LNRLSCNENAGDVRWLAGIFVLCADLILSVAKNSRGGPVVPLARTVTTIALDTNDRLTFIATRGGRPIDRDLKRFRLG